MYARLNKSGCEERKGNVKVRLDFYLEPTDPRYNDTYLPIRDPETGEPTGEYRVVPFHSHFVHLNPSVTVEDIKAEIDFHLSNFYKAFQDRWDETNGGMRHGWATEKRVRPTDYSKDTKRVAQCKNTVKKLTEFSYEPNVKEGRTYPATEIDIGPGATDRSNVLTGDYTLICLTNQANDAGTIDTYEIWAASDLDGTNKVGTLDWTGPIRDYTPRDYESIGTVTAGAKRTFTGLTIDVAVADYAGIYYSAGNMERDYEGGGGLHYLTGDQWDAGEQSYSEIEGDEISIYGTGETPVTDYPISTGSSLSLTSTLSRTLTLDRGVSPSITLAASLARAWTHSMTTSVGITLTTSLAKSWNRIQTITSNLSLAPTIARFRTIARAISTALGLTPQVQYPPIAITQTVTEVGSSTATLEGKIQEAAGGACEARFRYRVK